MKILTQSLAAITLLGTLTLCSAEVDINTQLEAIANAPAQERVQLMNQLKQQIAAMNAEDRAAAISQMRTQMQTQAQAKAQDGVNHADEHTEDGQGEMNQMQNRVQTQQQTHMQNMEHTEQMMQHQAMDQFHEAGNHIPDVSTPSAVHTQDVTNTNPLMH